jgi:hypothetical protein
MMELIYSPQPNATPDEVMQVMKVIVAGLTSPSPWITEVHNLAVEEWAKLPKEAQRHFKIVERPTA